MEFEHPTQHSIANLRRIATTLAAGTKSDGQALYLASQLTSHAHPWAEKMIADLREKTRHRQVLHQLDVIERCLLNVRRVFRFEDLSPEAREVFYKREGYIYLRHEPDPSSKLLVIFATMFNNFHVSNAALVHMLRSLDCNLLVLRDSSLLNYHRGVAGLARSIPEIAGAIGRVAQRERIEQVYFSGFSSCGYASLLVSLMTRCDGYLGFSQPIDLSGASSLPPPLYFTPEVRAAVDPAHLIDLKPMLAAANPDVPRTFVYGERNANDMAHIRHLQELEHLEFIALPDVSHSTVERLIADNALLPLFAKLISDR